MGRYHNLFTEVKYKDLNVVLQLKIIDPGGLVHKLIAVSRH